MNKYSKEQILKSQSYKIFSDLLAVLLNENDLYELTQVDKLINKFMKGAMN